MEPFFCTWQVENGYVLLDLFVEGCTVPLFGQRHPHQPPLQKWAPASTLL